MTTATYLIRSTAAIAGDNRFFRYGSAALVAELRAETYRHERTAQQTIDSFIDAGEWKTGQYRVQLPWR